MTPSLFAGSFLLLLNIASIAEARSSLQALETLYSKTVPASSVDLRKTTCFAATTSEGITSPKKSWKGEARPFPSPLPENPAEGRQGSSSGVCAMQITGSDDHQDLMVPTTSCGRGILRKPPTPDVRSRMGS